MKQTTKLVLSFLLLIPFLVLFLAGTDKFPYYLVFISAGLCIVSSGYFLGYGTERMLFFIPEALALAILALAQTAPEYLVEGVLAYKAVSNSEILHYVTANLTGANRLLIGLGWPAVSILSYFLGRKSESIELNEEQSIEVVFLGISTIYSFFIVAKGTLTIFDGIVLTLLFMIYIAFASRLPLNSIEEERPRNPLFILPLIIVGAFFVFVSADPFVTSMIMMGKSLGVNDYLLIQWLAPVLSEAPEAVTVIYWSVRSNMSRVAVANLLSSKINQWTLLFALIPIVYSSFSGSLSGIRLTSLQADEILLTASQSLFGFLCLVDMRLSNRESIIIFMLFATQLFLPETRFYVSLIYLSLSFIRLLTEKNSTRAISFFVKIARYGR